ncbi:hypothetical protein Palpr_0576 [Paludibacter propionicigenes WB4]|uniref:Radical SAM domain protein n=1 Tax=Paludibacter propionicigenes (strain DSM 17365 / JCM 13257 / WB4) TaxID=694427 RepID=E4T1Z0_PALPW|nr:hypothetical protein [Paludibacter propionicigenes]ADQ78734.1 hypothetical protein Palpr_0576 [Paludibacter propionicigenes WB4]
MTNRNILLLEPNYKNKYPPIGLMKIATYHRMLGDNITFFKGNLKDLVIKNITDLCIDKLKKIDNSINWFENRNTISVFIRTKNHKHLEQLNIDNSDYKILIYSCIENYKNYYSKKLYEKEPYYDRIYVTTLFTFYWKITIETINFSKKLVKDLNELKVGGISATILSDDIIKETGITPNKGLLDKPGILDKDNEIIIDTLPLDYSILDEIDYKYPENEAYYGYMTRGCIRKCSFCAVPTLEPRYDEFIPISQYIEETKLNFGEKRNLLLLDNNVLASPSFPNIIEEIKQLGFIKGGKYTEPNQLEISIRNLKLGLNDKAYIRRSYTLLRNLLNKIKGNEQQNFYNLLEDNDLLKPETVTKDKLLNIYPLISELYTNHYKHSYRLRYVDFNQGVDARLINESNIKLLSEIPIHPLRIAFDSIKYKEQYCNAIRLAAKYDIKYLSNYILYNDTDTPLELYYRLKINIDLSESLNISIYSFPMKFHPIVGEDRFNRNYLGKYWNRKFIRSVQAILNVTKGKVGKGRSFFNRAFGQNEEEFIKLLYMPESYILYRSYYEKNGKTDTWWNDFNSLNELELIEAKNIIEKNDFKHCDTITNNSKIIRLLKHYLI